MALETPKLKTCANHEFNILHLFLNENQLGPNFPKK